MYNSMPQFSSKVRTSHIVLIDCPWLSCPGMKPYVIEFPVNAKNDADALEQARKGMKADFGSKKRDLAKYTVKKG